jgi:DNA-directed RNA polymerase subunit RPC12/RpoP
MNQTEETTSPDTAQALYCANHPNVETYLRCSRCGKPICIRCAQKTPTGYRCPDCLRSQQRVFTTSRWYDYPVAMVIAFVLSFLGSRIVPFLGFFILFLAPPAGVLIAAVIRVAVGKRRGIGLFRAAAGAAAAGSLLIPVAGLVVTLLSGGRMGSLLSLLWYGVYAFFVTSSVYASLSGIQMRR